MSEQEPVITANLVAAAVGATIVMLVSLGIVDLSAEQQAAILGAVVAILPLIAAVWARMKVTPLINARDTDGEALTRHDGTPALPEQKLIHKTFYR